MKETWLLLVLTCFVFSNVAWGFRQPAGPVKNYVVLMMENRAYDHLLGYFQMPGSHLEGLTGQEYNLWNPTEPNSRRIKVSSDAKDVRLHHTTFPLVIQSSRFLFLYITPSDDTRASKLTIKCFTEKISPNPDHSVKGTTEQIFGTHSPKPGAAAPMDGFVANSRVHLGDDVAHRIMQCWNATKLPVITALARSFTLFDHWHASVPGPTYGNRMYFHAGTSDGYCNNRVPEDGFQIKTIYELLDNAGYDWAFYFDQVLDASFFNYTRNPRFANRLHKMKAFAKHAQEGKLPTLAFMMPRFFSTPNIPANDQHPSHAVSLGEELIRKVYHDLRQSPSWNQSALLLTYDEHGGFYDHVPTPLKVPNPDGKNCEVPSKFDFNRLGLRVPTILISPWVNHSVVHHPQAPTPDPNSRFEHSSFIATLTRQLGLEKHLTKRTAWAAPFDHLFSRTTPRTDCPLTLPPIHQESLAAYKAERLSAPEHLQPLDDLHISYIQATNTMLGLHPDTHIENLKTEHDGAKYVNHLVDLWKKNAAQ